MIICNGVELAWSEGSVAELVVHLGFPQKGIALAINGEIVPRSAWSVTTLTAGSVVNVVTATAGG